MLHELMDDVDLVVCCGIVESGAALHKSGQCEILEDKHTRIVRSASEFKGSLLSASQTQVTWAPQSKYA